MKNNFNLKICAIFTVIVYAVSSFHGSGILFAQAAQPSIFTNSSQAFSIPSLPEYLGRTDLVGLSASPKKAKGFLFAIQDAHTSREAQRQIVKLLTYLNQKQPLDKIFLEGAVGPLDATRLEVFNSTEQNEKFWDDLLSAGLIDGATRFLLSHPEIRAIGLEDVARYRQNLETYREVMGHSALTERWLDRLQVQVNQRMTRSLSDDVLKRLKEWQSFFDESGMIQDKLQMLFQDFEKTLHIDWKEPKLQIEFPNLVRLCHLTSHEQKTDFIKAKIQWGLLKRALGLTAEPEAQALDAILSQRIQKSIPFFRSSTPFRAFAEKIAEQMARQDRSFLDFSDFFEFLACEIYREEMDAEELSREIHKLQERLIQSWVRDREGLKAVRLYQDFYLLNAAYRLELTPEQVRDLRSRVSEIHPQTFLEILGMTSSDDFVRFEKIFSRVLEFYDEAKARESGFFLHLSEEIRDQPDLQRSPMAMVSGGFHRAGIQEILNKLSLRHAVIYPRFLNESKSNQYREAMLGNYSNRSTLTPFLVGLHAEDATIAQIMGEKAFENWKRSVAFIFALNVKKNGLGAVRAGHLPFGLLVDHESLPQVPLKNRAELRGSFSWPRLLHVLMIIALLGLMPGCSTMGTKRIQKNLTESFATPPRQLEDGKEYVLNDESSPEFIMNSYRVQKAREEATTDKALAKLKTGWSVNLKPQVGTVDGKATVYFPVEFQGPLGKIAVIAQNPVQNGLSAGFEGAANLVQLALGKLPVQRFAKSMKEAEAFYGFQYKAGEVARDEGILRVKIDYLKGKQKRLSAQVQELDEVVRPKSEQEYHGGTDTIRDLADMRKAVLDLGDQLSETKRLLLDKERELRELLFPNEEDQRHPGIQIGVTHHDVPETFDITALQARATEGSESNPPLNPELAWQYSVLGETIANEAESWIQRFGSLEGAYLKFVDSVTGPAGSKAVRNPLTPDNARRQYTEEATALTGNAEFGSRRQAEAALSATSVRLKAIESGEMKNRIQTEIRKAVDAIQIQNERLSDLKTQLTRVEGDLAEEASHSAAKMMKTRLNHWRIQESILSARQEIEINLRRLAYLRAIDFKTSESEKSESSSTSRSELRAGLRNSLILSALIGLTAMVSVSHAHAAGLHPSGEPMKGAVRNTLLLKQDAEAMKAAREQAAQAAAIKKVASLTLPTHATKQLPSSNALEEKKVALKKSLDKAPEVKKRGHEDKTDSKKEITPKQTKEDKKAPSAQSETSASKINQTASQHDQVGPPFSKGDSVTGVTQSGRKIPGVVRSVTEVGGKLKANVNFQPVGSWDAVSDPVTKIQSLKKDNLEPSVSTVKKDPERATSASTPTNAVVKAKVEKKPEVSPKKETPAKSAAVKKSEPSKTDKISKIEGSKRSVSNEGTPAKKTTAAPPKKAKDSEKINHSGDETVKEFSKSGFRPFHWMGRQFSDAGKWVGRQFVSTKPETSKTKEKKGPENKKKKPEAAAESKGEVIDLSTKRPLDRLVLQAMFSNQPVRIRPADELPPEMLGFRSSPNEASESLPAVSDGGGSDSWAQTQAQAVEVSVVAVSSAKSSEESAAASSNESLAKEKKPSVASGNQVAREIFYSAPAAFAGFDRTHPGDATLSGELFTASIDGSVDEVVPGKIIFQKGEPIFRLKSDRGLTTRLVNAPTQIKIIRWRAGGYVKAGEPVLEYYGANHFPARIDLPSGLVDFQGISALLETQSGQKIPAEPLWVKRGKVSGDNQTAQAVTLFQLGTPLNYWEDPVKKVHLIRNQKLISGNSFSDAADSVQEKIYFAPVSLRVQNPVHAPSGGTFRLAKLDGSEVKAGDQLGIMVSASGNVNILARSSGNFVGGYVFAGLDVVPGMRLGQIDEPEIQIGDPEDASLLVKTNAVSLGQTAQVLLPNGTWLPGTVSSVTAPVADQVRNFAGFRSVVVTVRHPFLLHDGIQKGASVGILFSDRTPQPRSATSSSNKNSAHYVPFFMEDSGLPQLVELAEIDLAGSQTEINPETLSKKLVQILLRAEDPWNKKAAFEYFTLHLRTVRYLDQLAEMAEKGSEDLSMLAFHALRDQTEPEALEKIISVWDRAVRDRQGSEDSWVASAAYDAANDLLKKKPEIFSGFVSGSRRNPESRKAAENFFKASLLINSGGKLRLADIFEAEIQRRKEGERLKGRANTPSTQELFGTGLSRYRIFDAETPVVIDAMNQDLDQRQISLASEGYSFLGTIALRGFWTLEELGREANESHASAGGTDWRYEAYDHADLTMDHPEKLEKNAGILAGQKHYRELARMLESPSMPSKIQEQVVFELSKTLEGRFYLAEVFYLAADPGIAKLIFNKTDFILLGEEALQSARNLNPGKDSLTGAWVSEVYTAALLRASELEKDPKRQEHLLAYYFLVRMANEYAPTFPQPSAFLTDKGTWQLSAQRAWEAALRMNNYPLAVQWTDAKGRVSFWSSVYEPGSLGAKVRELADPKNYPANAEILASRIGMHHAMAGYSGNRGSVERIAEGRIHDIKAGQRPQINGFKIAFMKQLTWFNVAVMGIVFGAFYFYPRVRLYRMRRALAKKRRQPMTPEASAEFNQNADAAVRDYFRDKREADEAGGGRSELRKTVEMNFEELMALREDMEAHPEKAPEYSKMLHLVRVILNDPMLLYQPILVKKISMEVSYDIMHPHYLLIMQLRAMMKTLLESSEKRWAQNPGSESTLERREVLYILEMLGEYQKYSAGLRRSIDPLGILVTVRGNHVPRFYTDRSNSLLGGEMSKYRLWNRWNTLVRKAFGIELSKESAQDIIANRLKDDVLEQGHRIERHLYNESVIVQSMNAMKAVFQRKMNPVSIASTILDGFRRRDGTRTLTFVSLFFFSFPMGFLALAWHWHQLHQARDPNQDPYLVYEEMLQYNHDMLSQARKRLLPDGDPLSEVSDPALKLKALQLERQMLRLEEEKKSPKPSADYWIVARPEGMKGEEWNLVLEQLNAVKHPATQLLTFTEPFQGELDAYLQASEKIGKEIPGFQNSHRAWFFPEPGSSERVSFVDEDSNLIALPQSLQDRKYSRIQMQAAQSLGPTRHHQDRSHSLEVLVYGPYAHVSSYTPRGDVTVVAALRSAEEITQEGGSVILGHFANGSKIVKMSENPDLGRLQKEVGRYGDHTDPLDVKHLRKRQYAMPTMLVLAPQSDAAQSRIDQLLEVLKARRQKMLDRFNKRVGEGRLTEDYRKALRLEFNWDFLTPWVTATNLKLGERAEHATLKSRGAVKKVDAHAASRVMDLVHEGFLSGNEDVRRTFQNLYEDNYDGLEKIQEILPPIHGFVPHWSQSTLIGVPKPVLQESAASTSKKPAVLSSSGKIVDPLEAQADLFEAVLASRREQSPMGVSYSVLPVKTTGDDTVWVLVLEGAHIASRNGDGRIVEMSAAELVKKNPQIHLHLGSSADEISIRRVPLFPVAKDRDTLTGKLADQIALDLLMGRYQPPKDALAIEQILTGEFKLDREKLQPQRSEVRAHLASTNDSHIESEGKRAERLILNAAQVLEHHEPEIFGGNFVANMQRDPHLVDGVQLSGLVPSLLQEAKTRGISPVYRELHAVQLLGEVMIKLFPHGNATRFVNDWEHSDPSQTALHIRSAELQPKTVLRVIDPFKAQLPPAMLEIIERQASSSFRAELRLHHHEGSARRAQSLQKNQTVLLRHDEIGVLLTALYVTQGIFRKGIAAHKLKILLQDLENLSNNSRAMTGNLAEAYQISREQVTKLENGVQNLLKKGPPETASQNTGVIFLDADLFSNNYLLQLAEKQPGLVIVFHRKNRTAFRSFSAQLDQLKLPANVYAVGAEQGLSDFIRQALSPMESAQVSGMRNESPALSRFLRKPGRTAEDFVVVGSDSDELKKVSRLEVQNRYVMTRRGLKDLADGAARQFEDHAALKYYGLLLFLHDENLFRMGSSGRIVNVYSALSGMLQHLLQESRQMKLIGQAA